MKKKSGPKPKSQEQKARKFGISVPAIMGNFLDEKGNSSEIIQDCIEMSPIYQKWVKKRYQQSAKLK